LMRSRWAWTMFFWSKLPVSPPCAVNDLVVCASIQHAKQSGQLPWTSSHRRWPTSNHQEHIEVQHLKNDNKMTHKRHIQSPKN
jgi:hypothetical protein